MALEIYIGGDQQIIKRYMMVAYNISSLSRTNKLSQKHICYTKLFLYQFMLTNNYILPAIYFFRAGGKITNVHK